MKIGNIVGYWLILEYLLVILFLMDDDYFEIRVLYIKYLVWVMVYNWLEKWVGGFYSDRSCGDDGLVVWSSR